MQLYVIRHGATRGNKEQRYVGSTDEALEPEAELALKKWELPRVDRVFVSPMKRCRQTADIIYPGVKQTVVEEFQECDFGGFEYCNYRELDGNPAYQHFIDTMGMSGFPGGEDRDTFQKRCVTGFERMMQEICGNCQRAALVVHGGTIMALFDWYSVPHRDYFEWQIGNGKGYTTEVVKDNSKWKFTDVCEIEDIRGELL